LRPNNVVIGVALGPAWRSAKHQNTEVTPASTRDNSTNMDPMELAVEAMEAQGEGEKLSYTKVAEKYNVSRHTLARRCKGIQAPVQDKAINQRKLNPQQEEELIKYVEKLTVRGLSPTREMLRRFASGIAQEEVGKQWVTRFVNRHHDQLVSRWTAGMDFVRHQADSEQSYTQYFEVLHGAIEK
jgi:transposase